MRSTTRITFPFRHTFSHFQCIYYYDSVTADTTVTVGDLPPVAVRTRQMIAHSSFLCDPRFSARMHSLGHETQPERLVSLASLICVRHCFKFRLMWLTAPKIFACGVNGLVKTKMQDECDVTSVGEVGAGDELSEGLVALRRRPIFVPMRISISLTCVEVRRFEAVK